MVDRKVCNALTDNKSSSSCYICMAKPSEMNNLSKIDEKSCNQCDEASPSRIYIQFQLL